MSSAGPYRTAVVLPVMRSSATPRPPAWWLLSTAIRICPATVTKSTPWLSQRAIGLLVERAARSAPIA
jgi:hypothetical protein